MPTRSDRRPSPAFRPDRRRALRLAACATGLAVLGGRGRAGWRRAPPRFVLGRATPKRGEPLDGVLALAPREVRLDGREEAFELERLRALEVPARDAAEAAPERERLAARLEELAAKLLADPRDAQPLAGWLALLARGWSPALPLGAPLEGSCWVVPDTTRHHAAHAASAWALDLAPLDARGRVHTGGGRRNEDYAGWDAPLLAVADGRVRSARDDRPDDPAFEGVADPERANDLVLELGGSGLAFYQHLKQGSLEVAPGDEVHRGDVLARLGNSGNASWPHLHFALYESFEAGERRGWLSVPFAPERCRLVGFRERVRGKARRLDLSCARVAPQEGWVVAPD